MEYSLQEFTIKHLVELIDKDLIDLNPDYQRNYIWSPNDQKSLIDTIINGYPLPSFFVYLDKNGKYEMVDGQQRSKTIFRFIKGQITSSKQTGSKYFKDLINDSILFYKMPFIVIENLDGKDKLQDFYVLINKKGVHLNPAEVNKSEHLDKLFLKLANEVIENQNLINLNLFTETTIKRMNDRAYIEELLSYLKLGIKEKKQSVNMLYDEDISQDEYKVLKEEFETVINKITLLNQITPIAETRYKQKNDFYTLFSFIHKNNDLSQTLFDYQYRILLIMDSVDEDGRQFIRPTNEECLALKEYAYHCVSQSNSKKARESRLAFFEAILKNIDIEENDILQNVLTYLAGIYGKNKISLKEIEGFSLLDVEMIKK